MHAGIGRGGAGGRGRQIVQAGGGLRGKGNRARNHRLGRRPRGGARGGARGGLRGGLHDRFGRGAHLGRGRDAFSFLGLAFFACFGLALGGGAQAAQFVFRLAQAFLNNGQACVKHAHVLHLVFKGADPLIRGGGAPCQKQAGADKEKEPESFVHERTRV